LAFIPESVVIEILNTLMGLGHGMELNWTANSSELLYSSIWELSCFKAEQGLSVAILLLARAEGVSPAGLHLGHVF
jgi:hypothetical protein